jgi:hypothetical protein
VDPEDNKEETSGHRALPINVHYDASNIFHVKAFKLTIAFVGPDMARKRVCENTAQVFPWHWPGDDASILPILTSIVYMTILSSVNVAIAGGPDPRWIICNLWGILVEPNGDGDSYSGNVTPIFDPNTAARSVQGARIFSNPTDHCIVYHSQPPAYTDGAQTPRCCGRSNLPLDYIVPPRAEDMINNIREQTDDDCKKGRPKSVSFPTIKTAIQKFERTLQRGLSVSNVTLLSSETLLMVSLPNMSKPLRPMRMWLGCMSTIKL